MEEPGLIADYLDRLERELGFDPALARRVRDETRDHLLEATECEQAKGSGHAERRAIARFGDARAIAAQLATGALRRRTRRLSVVLLAVVALIFVAMKARVAWYAQQQWAAGPSADLAAAVAAIDRGAFWASLLAALVACVHLGRVLHAPGAGARLRRELERFLHLCIASCLALAICVAGDGVLTTLRIAANGWSAAAAVPVLTVALEAACAVALLAAIRTAVRALARAPIAP